MKAINTPAPIVTPWGVDAAFIAAIPVASQVSTIPNGASLMDGFPVSCFQDPEAGGLAPRGVDFNGILNLLSQSLVWAQAGGQYVYNGTYQTAIAGYPQGALIARTDLSGWWVNQVDQNTTNPEALGAGWVPLSNPAAPLAIALTNANVTLTALQAAALEFTLTGTLTANVELIVPAWIGTRWIINNKTTGAFTVTVQTAAGTGVILQSGTTQVHSDGTNVVLSVAFLQNGTSAVLRPFQDKSRDTVSVRDYMTPAQIADSLTGSPTLNTNACFVAACTYLQALGGGTLDIEAGTYLVGAQTFAGTTGLGYSYLGIAPISFSGLTHPIKIRCKGAVLTMAAGLKFGSYNPTTGASYTPTLPFTNTDYQASVGNFMQFTNCASVEVDSVELNGNAAGAVLGGQWGDTGYQCPGSGISVQGCNNVTLKDVYAHHCCLDGLYVGYQSLTETSPIYPHTLIGCRSEFNSRQGLSWTGGTHIEVLGGSYSNTGNNGSIASAPMCGIDVEPSSTVCKNGTFVGVQFINNAGGNPGSNANRPDIQFVNCRFVGTTNYSWFGGGNCEGCTFEGETVIAAPSYFHNCQLTMAPISAATLYGNYACTAGTTAGYAILDGCTINAGLLGACFNSGLTTTLQYNNCTLIGTSQTLHSDFTGSVITGLVTTTGATISSDLSALTSSGVGVLQCTQYASVANTYTERTGTTTTGLLYNSSGDGNFRVYGGAYWVNGKRVVGAQITGYGTPTGGVRISNFPGASATLVQCSEAIAQLIADFETHGMLGV
jgi:hypothetical protein